MGTNMDGINYLLKLDTNSAYASTHDFIVIYVKFVSLGKIQFVFNNTITMIDLKDASAEAAELGISFQ